MRQDRVLWIVGAPVMAVLLMQGCSAISGSGTGEEGRAGEERIREQAIKEAAARKLDRSDELSARNKMESVKESLMDVLFDFDQDHLRTDALPVLEANAKQLKDFKTKTFDSVIATSGMAGNLADIICLKQTGRPLPQQNLARVALKDLRLLETELARSSLKARLALPGLDPKRVDTLLPAAVVLRRLLELTGQDEMTLCDKAIREGVIYDFIAKHREGLKAETEIPDVRRRNVIGLARRCHAPEVHSLHVADLALRLFDQTKRLHGLGPQERGWLEYAAILHDIGYLINPRQHHKHAYYLIMNSDLGGLTADDIEVIANVARYHRRAVPGLRHQGFESLTPRLKRVVRILSALLRVADGLDRTHFSVVRTVSVKAGKMMTIEATVTGDAEMELWAAKNRADLFQQVFRKRVRFSKILDEKESP
ncbi:MAG: HD domain-containing protein [Nitrospira sp.]|nr:HD domain-containing protein [Nitrospira sp.]